MKLGKLQRCVCPKCCKIIPPENEFNCPECGKLDCSLKVTYKKNETPGNIGDKIDFKTF
jgi:hypothetical protein